MAIKVSNTTVIDDARQLTNISGIDATSKTALQAAGVGGISYIKKTAAYTAVDKDGIIADTSGGAFTITLPATPTLGAQVQIVDGAAWGTNNLTVGRNGSTIDGTAQDLVLDITGASVTFIYDGATWQVYAQVGAGTGEPVTVSNTVTLSNKTLSGVVIADGYTEETVSANTGTAYTISLTNGSVQILQLTGNCTYTFPTPVAGKSFTLIQKQDATGNRTVTWPASVKWPAGTAPTITSTASKIDKFVFTAIDGTSWLGSVAGLAY